MIRLTHLLPAQPVFHRRQNLRRIAELKEADMKIQAQRRARLARQGTPMHRFRPTQKRPQTVHPQAPAMAIQLPPQPKEPPTQAFQNKLTPVAPLAPTTITAQSSPIARAVQARGRGTYANDFSGRRAQQYSRSSA